MDPLHFLSRFFTFITQHAYKPKLDSLLKARPDFLIRARPEKSKTLVTIDQNEVVVIENLHLFLPNKLLPPDILHYIHKLHPLL